MKKIILFISLFFTSVLITNATPCKVISGDGTHIGDEIQCGTENFYVLSNDGEEIKMLTKYNLYVGAQYEIALYNPTTNRDEIYSQWFDEYGREYDLAKYLQNEEGYYGVLHGKELDYEVVKQDETALGAHGGSKGEPVFPEIGVIDGMWHIYPELNDKEEEPSYDEGYSDFDVSEYEYLTEYNKYLSSLDITTNDISMLAISEINEIVYSITEEYLPLEDWWYNWEESSDIYHDNYYVIGTLKDYLNEEYSWLWGTTYWTRTKVRDEADQYFVDTLGNVCNATYACPAAIGAGIRPVVTIPAYLIYTIETKTDGNGTVEADHIEAENGTVVKFTVTPKEGFKLKEVKVTDQNGNIITFTDYTFTMPNANVTIEAIFEPENPNTVDIILITFATLLISGITLTYINYRKTKLR